MVTSGGNSILGIREAEKMDNLCAAAEINLRVNSEARGETLRFLVACLGEGTKEQAHALCEEATGQSMGIINAYKGRC